MTLLHWAESWHDREHAARLSSRPDPLLKYPSLAGLHALPCKEVDGTAVLGLVVVVVPVLVVVVATVIVVVNVVASGRCSQREHRHEAKSQKSEA